MFVFLKAWWRRTTNRQVEPQRRFELERVNTTAPESYDNLIPHK